MNILILGPQGSGKGTQASKLAKRYNLFYLDMGNFLRDLAKKRDDIDEVVNKKGGFLNEELTVSLVQEFLNERGIYDNIVFDGFPRSVKQYELFSKFLEDHNKKINLAILLGISDKEAVRRLSARRIDKKTGKIYNLVTNPPTSLVDPKDLVQREDDKEVAVKKRLSWYKEIVIPLANTLENQGILRKVDGERPINVIFKDLVKIVEKG